MYLNYQRCYLQGYNKLCNFTIIAFKNNATLSPSSPLKYDTTFVYTIDFKSEEIKELELYDYDEEHESCDSRNK